MRELPILQAFGSKLLKKDVFGEVRLEEAESCRSICRDTRCAHWLVRWLARRLLAREARALRAAAGVEGVPGVKRQDRQALVRDYIEGQPLQVARPTNPGYYRRAAQLVRRLHRLGIAHNDLAKEPNLLVTVDGNPALVDFQIAIVAPRRGKLFRLLAREDLRHLLKHKRSYCPDALTARERQILDTPGLLSRLWMRSGKRVYLWITRGLLGWRDREGAGDRFQDP